MALRSHDLGSGARIPTLGDVLDWAKARDALLNVELKQDVTDRAFWGLMARYGGAVAALLMAGAPKVWVVNRTVEKAEAIAHALGRQVVPLPLAHAVGALRDSTAVINATSAGLSEDGGLDIPLETTPEGCAIMDMLYKPLETPFLARARALGRPTVDGLEMLIRQAEPSFEAFFGEYPPAEVDVRKLALEALAPPDDSFLGWGREQWVWTRTLVEVDYHRHNVKAWHPIDINFIGYDEGGVDIRSENRDRNGESEMNLAALTLDQDFGERLHLHALVGTTDSTSGGTAPRSKAALICTSMNCDR